MFSFYRLCFLCLGNYPNLKPVLIENNEGLLVLKKLKYCLPEIDVDFHSEIQKYICINCTSKLESLCEFKQTCLRNNKYLKSYFQISPASESYKNLSVDLPDITSQNKPQTVSSGTLATVGSNEQLQTKEKQDNETCVQQTKAVFTNEIKHSEIDIEDNTEITVKEEFITPEDNVDTEFPLEFVKCEAVSSDSEVSVSKIEDILHEDSKHCNNNSDNKSTEPKEKIVKGKSKIKKIKKFQCGICSREYPHKLSLDYHLKSHAGIKDFSCAICKKKFIHKSNLNQHEKIHTGIKNFECLICNKKFIHKSHLTEHEKIHTGIRNFECSICKKKFKHKSNLIIHANIHTRIKNYECLVCKKKFMHKSNLIEHEKVHIGIQTLECPICKKKFIQKRNLRQHEKIHTGIRNYECPICKKKFLTKGNLIKHEKIHTGIKNYECSVCKNKFTQKITLIKHEKIHTGINV